MRSIMPIVLVGLVLVIAQAPAEAGRRGGERAVGSTETAFQPVPSESRNFELGDSYGLFVGIGDFRPNSRLEPLRYTVDDAIALAHLFAAELDLIPVENAMLALSGEPKGEDTRRKLDDLRVAGAEMIEATGSDILIAVEGISARASNPNGLVVMTFSSHGFEERGEAFIMPYDGVRAFIERTGVSLEDVRQALGEAEARKKLLIIDACREIPGSGARGKSAMSASLQAALQAAEGFAIMASCKVGQLSYEDAGLGRGVFTHFLLEGFRGGARADPETGLIRLGDVSAYAAQKTRDWVRLNRGEEQVPWFEGEFTAREIPVAISPEVIQRQADKAAREQASLGILLAARDAYPDLVTFSLLAELEQALQTAEGAQRDKLVQGIGALEGATRMQAEFFLSWWNSLRNDYFEAAVEVVEPDAPPPKPWAKLTIESEPSGAEVRLEASGELLGKTPVTVALRPGEHTVLLSLEGHLAASRRIEMTSEDQVVSIALAASDFTVSGLDLDMIWVAPGTFEMGSPPSEKGRSVLKDEHQHWVTLSRGYWLGKYEVTQGQWEALMGSNPSHFRSVGDRAPVEQVSWLEAMEYCRKLTERERAAGRLPPGYVYTLPTEAQWEYACRAGTTTRFHSGDHDSDLDTVGWYSRNSNSTTHPVGQKQANAWGFHDMHGNVWEWCLNWWGDYPYLTIGGVTDPRGPNSGSYRVTRGGSWLKAAANCRSADRQPHSGAEGSRTDGFRLALSFNP